MYLRLKDESNCYMEYLWENYPRDQFLAFNIKFYFLHEMKLTKL